MSGQGCEHISWTLPGFHTVLCVFKCSRFWHQALRPRFARSHIVQLRHGDGIIFLKIFAETMFEVWFVYV